MSATTLPPGGQTRSELDSVQQASLLMKTHALRRAPQFDLARSLLLIAAALLLANCTALSSSVPTDAPAHLDSHGLSIATDVKTCRATLGQPKPATLAELDARRISVLSWNIHKGLHRQWIDDLGTVGASRDLVLLQEARLDRALTDAIQGLNHWAFAPGYRHGNRLTGVITVSSSPPLTHCNLSSQEPWLRTPKTMTITEYGLTGTHQTLAVVNIHAINFSLGLKDFRRQLAQVGQVLQAHAGPMIVSGDFNTWRPARQAVVEALAEELGLAAVVFEEEHRTRFFGQEVDHLYVRGLSQRTSATYPLESSDHNPLAAELHL
jgi:endonuclease/exonuclease/phosphatase (EEP) superfamily protein YafD